MLSWSCRDLLVQLWRSYLCFSFSRTELVLSSERFVPRDARSEGRSKLTTRTAASASVKAVNFSSARTTKRFPSPRCASATKIVRPLESTAEPQPQLQPALLRLSAIISQYFVRGGFCLLCSLHGNNKIVMNGRDDSHKNAPRIERHALDVY